MQKLSKISIEQDLCKHKLIVFGELFTDTSDSNNHKVLRFKFTASIKTVFFILLQNFIISLFSLPFVTKTEILNIFDHISQEHFLV